jgi:hypothetical protein
MRQPVPPWPQRSRGRWAGSSNDQPRDRHPDLTERRSAPQDDDDVTLG